MQFCRNDVRKRIIGAAWRSGKYFQMKSTQRKGQPAARARTDGGGCWLPSNWAMVARLPNDGEPNGFNRFVGWWVETGFLIGHGVGSASGMWGVVPL